MDRDRYPLASNAPVGIFKLAESGEFVFGNERFHQLLGVGPDDLDHEVWLDRMHPDDRPKLIAEWQTATREGREFHIEYRINRAHGDVVLVDSRAVRVPG